MTTLAAFNEMMGQFIGELAQTFPDEPKIKEVQAAPMNRATFDQFMKDITPWVSQMMAKDPAFFCEANPVAANLNLHNVWTTEDCTENTKAAIWQYYQTLYMLGTTINMFPPETLSMIESAAENCAKNMKKAPNGQIDEASLMAGMNNMLSQMLSGGGGGANPFAAMLGGAGPGQRPGQPSRAVPPKPKRKATKKISK
jgi:hypothetical protein